MASINMPHEPEFCYSRQLGEVRLEPEVRLVSVSPATWRNVARAAGSVTCKTGVKPTLVLDDGLGLARIVRLTKAALDSKKSCLQLEMWGGSADVSRDSTPRQVMRELLLSRHGKETWARWKAQRLGI